MKYNIIHVHHGTVANEQERLTLLQFCNLCRLNPELVIEMVNEGIIEPEGERKIAWRFSNDALESAKKAQRLRHDLNVNLAGAALALELLDKIERLEILLGRRR